MLWDWLKSRTLFQLITMACASILLAAGFLLPAGITFRVTLASHASRNVAGFAGLMAAVSTVTIGLIVFRKCLRHIRSGVIENRWDAQQLAAARLFFYKTDWPLFLMFFGLFFLPARMRDILIAPWFFSLRAHTAIMNALSDPGWQRKAKWASWINLKPIVSSYWGKRSGHSSAVPTQTPGLQ